MSNYDLQNSSLLIAPRIPASPMPPSCRRQTDTRGRTLYLNTLPGAEPNLPCAISNVEPQFWQTPIVALTVVVLFVPWDFFQNRFDTPRVATAVTPLAALFTWPPKPTPFFVVCWPTSMS